MHKLALSAVLAVLLSTASVAAQNVGKCGWGSKLFDGQRGIAPQVLAVTTNGTSGNQTFAITSGTSGCTQDGVVRSSWQTAAYIGKNMNKLARDISRGQGENLDTLVVLLEVEDQHRPVFVSTLQQNFSSIFGEPDADSKQVIASLKKVLEGQKELQKYSTRL